MPGQSLWARQAPSQLAGWPNHVGASGCHHTQRAAGLQGNQRYAGPCLTHAKATFIRCRISLLNKPGVLCQQARFHSPPPWLPHCQPAGQFVRMFTRAHRVMSCAHVSSIVLCMLSWTATLSWVSVG
jgi:hypothetical protein